MNSYPELENNGYKEPKDNRETIRDAYNSMKEKSNTIINNALSKNIRSLNSRLESVPKIYTQMRDKLTLTNNKAKKNLEEHIANTGNHTASGYAISKRQNNDNEYQKELNNINLQEAAERNEIMAGIEDAHLKSAEESIKVNNEYDYKMLQDILKETDRIDDYNYKINKDNRDYMLSLDKNNRENEKHQMEMRYEPEVYQAKLDGMYKDNALTDAKIEKTNAEIKKIGASGKSGSSSKSSASVYSKMSAKDIAKNIMKQAGTEMRDQKGEIYYDYDNYKAYTYLLEWRNKFKLTDQVVNDAAIYLGIQDYL